MEIDEHTLKNIYPHSRGLEVMVDKTIVFLGDSVMRGMYKDMLKYVKCGDLLKESESKRKGEVSFQDDLLVYGGDKLAKKTNGKEFREYRVIKCDNGIILKYHYICRAYNDHVESILESFVTDPPDIVVVNSCLWDLHRYRSEKRAAMESFKENVLKLAGKLSSIRVPQYQSEAKPPLCIWTTTPPCSCDVPIIEDFTEVSDDPNAYNFTAQIDEINAANIWLGQMLPNYSFNIIDLGTVMAKAVHNREKDGVHWNAAANRMFSMLILSRVEMQLARPGKQKIPTVIYSPLLYVAPVAQPVAKQPIIQQPAPMPYQEHQYYDGMNEFNDRYSFKQTSSNDYYQDYNQEQRGGPQSGGPHFGGPHGPRGGPPPHHGPLHGGPGPRGPQDLYAEEDRFSDPYSSYTNSYNYNDIMGAVGEQRSMGSRGPVSQSRALQERRHMQAAAKQTQRTVSRIPPQQHRYPPSRHVPPPRQNRRTRPY